MEKELKLKKDLLLDPTDSIIEIFKLLKDLKSKDDYKDL
jgi:hypothetical protein